ncbi:MAG: hypothetical protein HY686_05075 [Chloroflexi bacterium]|nr:hypothetical protein [Chloroflexota bacterium]
MLFLIGALVILLSVGILLIPFLQRDRRRATLPRDTSQEALLRREAIYQEINTLQLEYELGHINEADFQARLHDYRLQAAAALKEEVEQSEAAQALAAALEEEVKALRQANPAKDAASSSTGSPP